MKFAQSRPQKPQPGATRLKGSKDRQKKELDAAIVEKLKEKIDRGEAVTPLEVITEAMQVHYDLYRASKEQTEQRRAQERKDKETRWEALERQEETTRWSALDRAAAYAEKAAPYLHARLASTEVKGSVPVETRLAEEDRAIIQRYIGAVAK